MVYIGRRHERLQPHEAMQQAWDTPKIVIASRYLIKCDPDKGTSPEARTELERSDSYAPAQEPGRNMFDLVQLAQRFWDMSPKLRILARQRLGVQTFRMQEPQPNSGFLDPIIFDQVSAQSSGPKS